MARCAVLGSLTCVLISAAAAQTSTSTPWAVQKVVLSNVSAVEASSVVVSGSGEIFASFPPLSGIPVTNQAGDSTGGFYALIAKLSASGKLLYGLQLGGISSVPAIVPDAGENLYVAGVATATGLPVTPGAYRSTSAGDGTPFLCKLNATDGRPLFCTYLDDNVMQLAASPLTVDLVGNVYVIAYRHGSNVAATAGAVSAGSRNVVVMEFDTMGSRVFRAEFGGSGVDFPWSMVIDSGGGIYVTGSTNSPDFPGATNSPLPPPPATNPLGMTTPFIAKLNGTGTQIIYTVYGAFGEAPENIAVDSAGEIHLAAAEFSNVVQVLLRKYTADGTGIVYQTPFVRYPSVTYGMPIAIDDQGITTIASATTDIGFPIHNATSSCASPGGTNAYMVRIGSDGAILQSTFLAANGPSRTVALSAQASNGYIAASIGGLNSVLGSLEVGAEPAGATATALGCYGNGATFLGGPLAPGEIFSIFGEGLRPGTGVAAGASDLAGRSLGGVTVTFDGTPAPLLYAQSSQLNVIAPWEIAGRSQSELCVSYGSKSSCVEAAVAAASPGIFQYAGPNQTMYAAAVNQDGTLNSPAHPAPLGSIVSLYMTGLGMLSPMPADGSIVEFPLAHLTSQISIDFVTVGPTPPDIGATGEVLYAGPAPFEVAGLYQVNVRVPDSATTGNVTVTVQTADGSTYQTQAVIAIALQ